MKKKFLAGLVWGVMIFGLAGMAQAIPVQWATNGHYYDAISFPAGITWDEAKIVASNSTFLGMKGHLATVTSMDENSFIVNNLGGAYTLNTFFLGGFQPVGSPEPGGNWQWITGEIWSFSNWSGGEPNNQYGGDGYISQPQKMGWDEEALQLWNGNGTWNDIEQTAYWGGLIVEYEPAPVPEPATMLLFGIGFVSFLRRRHITGIRGQRHG